MTKRSYMGERAAEAVVIALMASAPSAGAQKAGEARQPQIPTKSVLELSPDVRRESRAAPAHLPVWAPPNVDDTVPPVAPNVPCPIDQVLHEAANRAREFVGNLTQFTATERVEHQEADNAGNWRKTQTVVFDYLTEIHEIRPSMLVLNETRNRSSSLDVFPAGFATLGLPAIAMIFHPYYVEEYNIACEGLGEWKGRPAWQLRFEQRPDRPARIRGYVLKDYHKPVKLKGRAWISRDDYQLLRMETDLMEPVPGIRLVSEHLGVEYRPVRFQMRDAELWLPENAEIYWEFGGHRYRRRHTFSDFRLFWVTSWQQIHPPMEP